MLSHVISFVCSILVVVLVVVIVVFTFNSPGTSSSSLGQSSFAQLASSFISSNNDETVCPANISSTLLSSLLDTRAMILAKSVSGEYQTTVLTNAHFVNGTFRLREPGLYMLGESILFSPNAQTDFRVPRASTLYSDHAYVLGFFAAITIESANVILDLDGFSIEASHAFVLDQRFFAVVELAARPFIMDQGPATFGSNEASANGLFIENGRIGRSSHHGIHGNNAHSVMLRNISFHDYEVAAVACNGCTRIALVNCTMQNIRDDIPIIGTYSNARFALPFAHRLIAELSAPHSSMYVNSTTLDAHDIAPALEALRTSTHTLELLVNESRADILATIDLVHDKSGYINKLEHPVAYELFANEQRIPDGTAYGVLFYPIGAAVAGFWNKPLPAHDSVAASHTLLLDRVTIKNTRASVTEVVVLVDADAHSVKGVAGDVLRIRDNTHNERADLFIDENTYSPTALSALQFSLMRLMPYILAQHQRRFFGTMRHQTSALAWAAHQITLTQLIQDANYSFTLNGDTMNHVNKGVMGLRIDGSTDVCVRDTLVAHTHNTGRAGNTRPLPGMNASHVHYRGALDGGHPGQGSQYGYMGADSRGISLAATRRIYLQCTRVDDVSAQAGFSRGIDLFNRANFTYVSCPLSNDNNNIRSCVNNVTSSSSLATGVSSEHFCAHTFFSANTILVSNVSAPSSFYGATSFSIYAATLNALHAFIASSLAAIYN